MRQTVIEKLRKAKGLSRVALAAAADVSEKSIINYEARYDLADPRPAFKKTQERVATALGVEVKAVWKNGVPR